MLCFSVVMQSMDTHVHAACGSPVDVIVLSDARQQLSSESLSDNNGLNHVVAVWVAVCVTELMPMQRASSKQDSTAGEEHEEREVTQPCLVPLWHYAKKLHIRLHISLSWLHICIWRTTALQPRHIAQQY